MVQAKPLNSQGYNRYNGGCQASDCSDGIFVENILLTNFRNYDAVKLDVAQGAASPIVLFGEKP